MNKLLVIKNSYKKLLAIATILFLVTLSFYGCGSANEVMLFDYEDLSVPSEVYEVPDADLACAIRMKLIEKEADEKKNAKDSSIEDSEPVKLLISENETEDFVVISNTSEKICVKDMTGKCNIVMTDNES